MAKRATTIPLSRYMKWFAKLSINPSGKRNPNPVKETDKARVMRTAVIAVMTRRTAMIPPTMTVEMVPAREKVRAKVRTRMVPETVAETMAPVVPKGMPRAVERVRAKVVAVAETRKIPVKRLYKT
jgi:hypothetical protein